MAITSTGPEIPHPAGLRDRNASEITRPAGEIRAFLIGKVTATGGHLGPDLGVVELTIALRRVFDSPHDTLLLDTGHQACVHKMLTGRAPGFDRLRLRLRLRLRRRRRGGVLSGCPSRDESDHDHIGNSHATTAPACADGPAEARSLSGAQDRRVVAVVGDGALTGGLALEALDNIGGCPDRPVTVVLSGNGRSRAPTAGALAVHLRGSRQAPRGTGGGSGSGGRSGPGGPSAHRSLFEALGFSCLGPVEGHDVAALESALSAARRAGGPVVVHALTVKGKGCRPAAEGTGEQMHTVGVLDPGTGKPRTRPAATWTDVFAEELLDLRAAVMGCVVNGPGEAREADLGVAAGDGRGQIVARGEVIRTVPEAKIVDALVEEAVRLTGGAQPS